MTKHYLLALHERSARVFQRNGTHLNRWMSREDRQVLESKDVSKDPQKQVSLGTQRKGGGILPRKATNVVLTYSMFKRENL